MTDTKPRGRVLDAQFIVCAFAGNETEPTYPIHWDDLRATVEALALLTSQFETAKEALAVVTKERDEWQEAHHVAVRSLEEAKARADALAEALWHARTCRECGETDMSECAVGAGLLAALSLATAPAPSETCEPATDTSPPWVLFTDEGEPVAIMPAERPGDVCRFVPGSVKAEDAQRIVAAVNGSRPSPREVALAKAAALAFEELTAHNWSPAANALSEALGPGPAPVLFDREAVHSMMYEAAEDARRNAVDAEQPCRLFDTIIDEEAARGKA